MLGRLTLLVAATYAAMGPPEGRCLAAQFWLTSTNPLTAGQLTSGSTPPTTAAQIPQVVHSQNATGGSLFVWARPDTGKTIEFWSLRVLVDDATVVRLTTSSVAVFNPLLGVTGGSPNREIRRWESVGEPNAPPSPSTNNTHLMQTISGVSVGGLLDRIGVGIGPSGAVGGVVDPFHHVATDAWLVARVDYTLRAVVGKSRVFLQLGSYGMGEDEPTTDSQVQFGALSDPALTGLAGRMVSSDTEEANILVTEHAGPPADFSGDMRVDGSDFIAWQRHLGTTVGGTHQQGDANADQQVDERDLAVWRQQFGATTPVARAAPEPASVLLLLFGGVLLAANGARRRRVSTYSRNAPLAIRSVRSQFAISDVGSLPSLRRHTEKRGRILTACAIGLAQSLVTFPAAAVPYLGTWESPSDFDADGAAPADGSGRWLTQHGDSAPSTTLTQATIGATHGSSSMRIQMQGLEAGSGTTHFDRPAFANFRASAADPRFFALKDAALSPTSYVIRFDVTYDIPNLPPFQPGPAGHFFGLGIYADSNVGPFIDAAFQYPGGSEINPDTSSGIFTHMVSVPYENFQFSPLENNFVGIGFSMNGNWQTGQFASIYVDNLRLMARNTWTATGGGNWSAAANWASGTAPNPANAIVWFDNSITAPATVTVNVNADVSRIRFENNLRSYTLAGDGSHSLELLGAAVIDSVAGDHSIGAPLIGDGSLAKAGAGTLRLTGANSYTGATTVLAGVLRASNAGNLGNTPSITVETGATLDMLDGPLFQLLPSQTLTGRGIVKANQITLPTTSKLAGTLQIQSNVTSAGRVAPGFSPGITTITGNYTQLATGVLEMEVGGLTAGTQHDKLVVSGAVTLDGRLEAPLINNFLPNVGQSVVLIQGGSVAGQFSSIHHRNPRPGVAIAIDYQPTAVQLNFVTASPHGYNTSSGGGVWSNPGVWLSGVVPNSTFDLTVMNSAAATQSVVVDVNAFAHKLALSAPSGSISVVVPTDKNLSVTHGVNVGANGVVELGGGTVLTSTLDVGPGGTVVGGGAVVGDVVVGQTIGPDAALFSPGTGVGNIAISGSYTQAAGGQMLLEVGGLASFDTINVSGNAALGGKLVVDVTNDAAVAPGMIIAVVTAGSLTLGAEFEDVLTLGSTDVTFVPVYDNALPVTLAAVTATSSVYLEGHPKGDLNLDGIFNPSDPAAVAADAAALGMAFVNPQAYKTAHGGTPGTIMGNVDGSELFDFDDIHEFRRISGLTMNQMAAALQAGAEVPEPNGLLLAAWGACGLVRRRRRVYF